MIAKAVALLTVGGAMVAFAALGPSQAAAFGKSLIGKRVQITTFTPGCSSPDEVRSAAIREGEAGTTPLLPYGCGWVYAQTTARVLGFRDDGKIVRLDRLRDGAHGAYYYHPQYNLAQYDRTPLIWSKDIWMLTAPPYAHRPLLVTHNWDGKPLN